MTTTFTGSVNIAMKIPAADYEATVAFYRDVLGLNVTEDKSDQPTVAQVHKVEFGPCTLWLDRIDTYAQPDVWLQVTTPDLTAAMTHLTAAGITTCDEIEPLAEGFEGHWIKNPAGVVHLVAREAS